MNIRRVTTLFFLIVAFTFSSCSPDKSAPAHYLSPNEADTLLTDMVTYIYNKPVNSTNQSRHNSEFRKYFIKSALLFKFEYYSVSPDSTHYFYLIRPARTLKGNQRGVGGKFRIDNSVKSSRRLLEFEELFNTVPMPEDSLRVYGHKIMNYLVKHNNFDPFLYDPAIVEWPDRFLRYDKIDQEWKAAVADSTYHEE